MRDARRRRRRSFPGHSARVTALPYNVQYTIGDSIIGPVQFLTLVIGDSARAQPFSLCLARRSTHG